MYTINVDVALNNANEISELAKAYNVDYHICDIESASGFPNVNFIGTKENIEHIWLNNFNPIQKGSIEQIMEEFQYAIV